MEWDLIKPFLDYGIIGAICGWLLYYVLTTTKERENKMTEESRLREDKLYGIIHDLTQKFESLGEKIDELGSKIGKKNKGDE